jgi:hypothetical protein
MKQSSFWSVHGFSTWGLPNMVYFVLRLFPCFTFIFHILYQFNASYFGFTNQPLSSFCTKAIWCCVDDHSNFHCYWCLVLWYTTDILCLAQAPWLLFNSINRFSRQISLQYICFGLIHLSVITLLMVYVACQALICTNRPLFKVCLNYCQMQLIGFLEILAGIYFKLWSTGNSAAMSKILTQWIWLAQQIILTTMKS